jgi:hypothetical protein
MPSASMIVLVPLDHRAVLHGGIADRHGLVEPALGQHEAADMLGQMARKAGDLVGEFERPGEQRIGRVEPRFLQARMRHLLAHAAPHDAGERRGDVLRQAHGLAHVAHRGAAAIGDDGGRQPGALAAVALVDVLNDLFAPLVLEIDVDVGRLLALLRDEALEQQVDLDGIDRGDAEAVAHGGIGRRAAALAEDGLVARAGEAHDVVDGEEIGGVTELVDEGELADDRRPDLVGQPLRIAFGRALPGQRREMVLRG